MSNIIFRFQSISSLLHPFGQCVDFLNPKVVEPMLAPGMEEAVKFVQGLEEKDLKEKVMLSIQALVLSLLGYTGWREEASHLSWSRSRKGHCVIFLTPSFGWIY
jgi:hypothetical protein